MIETLHKIAEAVLAIAAISGCVLFTMIAVLAICAIIRVVFE